MTGHYKKNFNVKFDLDLGNLLTSSVRSLQGNLLGLGLGLGFPQGLGLRFPCNDLTLG